MRTVEQKLASLTQFSAWIFTKQSTDFDDIFKATKLFYDYYETEKNLETVFQDKFLEYGISTGRHRILIMAQLFGLITKTPFFTRGIQYKNERTTEVFELLKTYNIDSPEYNTLKTEQLLKIRIKPIIDSAEAGYDKVLLPLIFTYQVLKTLKKQYGINQITTDQFYTYVLTSKTFKDVDETTYFLSTNPQAAPARLINYYKSNSRIETLFKKNSRLILFEKDNLVKINPAFENEFDNFLSQIDIEDLELILENQNAYAYFLYTPQNFNINLIDSFDKDEPDIIISSPRSMKQIVERMDDDETYDSNYVKLSDEVQTRNLNPDIAKDAYKKSIQLAGIRQETKIIRNPMFGKIAIQNYKYKCCYDNSHLTFPSKSTGEPFMEAHHLIPINFAEKIYEIYKINIDCVENIVSLCPNCHRAIHYGANRVKKRIITILFNKLKEGYNKIGLDLKIKHLFEMYNVNS